jgi:hypothetical protein
VTGDRHCPALTREHLLAAPLPHDATPALVRIVDSGAGEVL